jgi:AcrR family transcriptional regulator
MAYATLPPNKHQEKSLRTRALLLDAAIDSLADVGYGNASISDIAARAGVTRGAQVHHFRTRAELFAQVIEYLADRQRDALQRRIESAPRAATPAEMIVELTAATFSGRLGKASIELFVAISNDDTLRRRMLRVQRELTADLIDTCARLIGPDVPRDRLESAFWLTIHMVRGSTLDEMLGRDPQRRKQILADWTRLAQVALGSGSGTSDECQ